MSEITAQFAKRRKLLVTEALREENLSDEEKMLLKTKSQGAKGFSKPVTVKVLLSDMKYDANLKHLLEKAKVWREVLYFELQYIPVICF